MRIHKDCGVRGFYSRELTAAEVYRIGKRPATIAPDKFPASGDMRAWRFGSLRRAADAMIRYRVSVEPAPSLVPRYDEIYGKFRTDVRKIYSVEV